MTSILVLGAAIVALGVFGWLARRRLLDSGGRRKRDRRYFSVDLAKPPASKKVDP